ncbi:MAG: hypothetical protein HY000_40490 [Planctomycetes bacterium]|nr:hypothetical protein [Planctomycetota bacterium]
MSAKTRSIVVGIARAGMLACGCLLLLQGMESAAFALPPPPSSFSAPEIDPGSIGGAMTLLVGSAMLVLGRRSKK